VSRMDLESDSGVAEQFLASRRCGSEHEHEEYCKGV
jgi:hypothetical protein